MRIGIFIIALAGAIVAAGCSKSVSIVEATLSIDETRVEIILDSCNASLNANVAESNEDVKITITPLRGSSTSGRTCQDMVVVQLDHALGNRPIVDGATGASIPMSRSVASELEWPYDRSRFSEEQYEEALAQMVACLEAEDPAVDARVIQQLNWKWFTWDKPPDAEGTVSTRGLDQCEAQHLIPLQPST